MNLGQTPPKLYGVKLAGSIVAGKENFILIENFSNDNFFLVAYLLGKLSYIPECRKLILQRLPDSNLAHSLESKPYDLISDMYEYPLSPFFSIDSLLFLRAQPPEIVPTTTNIFGARNVEEEQQVDVLSPG
jgi:hypothetical protein